MTFARRAAAVAACAGVLVLAPYAPAQAADAPARDVVVTLRTPAAKARVTTYLRQHGYRVRPTDPWTVAARGPATAALRGALGGDAAQVAGLGRQHAWRHRAIPGGYAGPALRSAYDVVLPGSDGTGITIATVQFSGWDSGDLTTYAAAAGLADPNPTEVSVGGASTTTSNGGDVEVALDQEVLLAAAPNAAQRIYFGNNTTADAVLVYSKIATDAEAGLVDVVSTSWGMCEPFVDQDPSSRAALESALARITAAGATLFAASGDSGAYDCSAPDAADNTVAVDFPAASANAVAVGGTRLTGPTGSWSETAWSTPMAGAFKGYAGGGGESSSVARPSWQASLSPAGTHRLVPDVSALADPDYGVGFYAASAGGWLLGGGTSAAAPLVAGHFAATLASAGRTTSVGDIHDTLYANPTAFRDVVSGSNLLYNAGSGYDLATGLGSPRWSAIADALFGDPVVSVPPVTRTTTVPVNVTPVAGMTVVAWTVAEGASVTCDPNGSPDVPTQVALTAGADRATRVAVGALDDHGTCHVGSAPVLVDTHAPTASGSISAATGTSTRTVFAWGATDPAPSSGADKYDVCVYTYGYGCTSRYTGTTARSVTLTLTQGRTYDLRVTPIDRAGNRGAQRVTTRYVTPVDSAGFYRSGGWATSRSSADWYGSHLYATRKGQYASRTMTGTRYEIAYVAFSHGGTFDVYVGGVLVRRVNSYSATTQYRRIVLGAVFSTRKARAVKIVVRGTKDSRSGGTGVAFDAMRVAY
jgi:hypothetical protein